MKLVLVALFAWAIAFVAVLVTSSGIYQEIPSGMDILSGAVASFIISQLMTYLFYLPGLLWLRRRLKGTKPTWLFVLSSGIVLNVPAIVFLSVAIGDKFLVSEAIGFMTMIVLTGIVFAVGFTCLYQQKPPKEGHLERKSHLWSSTMSVSP